MSVDPTSGVTSASPAQAAAVASSTSDKIGKDAFLKLLVTQLQHQDPTKPLDDSAFLAQLAQFSSLEQLTQIAESTTALRNIFEALPGANSATTAYTQSTAATSI